MIATSRASDVREEAERRISFNFDQHNSMGDKSGEYGGKNLVLAPTDSMMAFAGLA
nr:hypothetical protein [Microcoleus sp. FACHB-831]